MNKLKVVIIIPSLETGGAENMVCQLSKTINRENFDLTLICLSVRKFTTFEGILLDKGIKVVFLNNIGKLSFGTGLSLWRTLTQIKPDIIHTHLHSSLYAFPWVMTHRKIMLHTIHNTPTFEFSPKIVALMRILYKRKKAIPIATSNKIKIETSQLYNIQMKDIEIVYNPVETNKFIRDRSKLVNEFVFINIARLNPQKNQQLLLHAFANVRKEVPNATLIIVGGGELKDELEKLTFSLQINEDVFFAGNVPDVENYLKKSDVFVLSSHYEGLPLSILEAMSAGLPIISTNVGGIADVIEENGILVTPGNLDELTNSMLYLAKDKSTRDKMAHTSIALSKKYDIAEIANQYEILYQKYVR